MENQLFIDGIHRLYGNMIDGKDESVKTPLKSDGILGGRISDYFIFLLHFESLQELFKKVIQIQLFEENHFKVEKDENFAKILVNPRLFSALPIKLWIIFSKKSCLR